MRRPMVDRGRNLHRAPDARGVAPAPAGVMIRARIGPLSIQTGAFAGLRHRSGVSCVARRRPGDSREQSARSNRLKRSKRQKFALGNEDFEFCSTTGQPVDADVSLGRIGTRPIGLRNAFRWTGIETGRLRLGNLTDADVA